MCGVQLRQRLAPSSHPSLASTSVLQSFAFRAPPPLTSRVVMTTSWVRPLRPMCWAVVRVDTAHLHIHTIVPSHTDGFVYAPLQQRARAPLHFILPLYNSVQYFWICNAENSTLTVRCVNICTLQYGTIHNTYSHENTLDYQIMFVNWPLCIKQIFWNIWIGMVDKSHCRIISVSSYITWYTVYESAALKEVVLKGEYSS